ncbi:hypothetical protein GCM10010399_64140 [Dactylosporangium fulvum]|uniref:Uncharacterized protein n=1 Tax=Dactylosporangium fulvum TaxID=53359 RepID=A0ABY5W6R9_9ACTN|nr:hypothetical protein [Dactylosporangium fulvum]UWP85763.1 hypothetical protein Dfulv_16585 [Dactylosporangium fulvum]
MTTDHQAHALKALGEIDRSEPGARLLATKVVRAETGCDLPTALAAVDWAMDRPPAALLPHGSVVATAGGAFFKEESSAESPYPWAASHRTGPITDAHVDELLRSDQATILRVGDGA